MAQYTQGICQDGAAILKDGKMMTTEEIIVDLNNIDGEFQPFENDKMVDIWIKLHEKQESTCFFTDVDPLSPLERELYDSLTKRFTLQSQIIGVHKND